MNLSLDQAVAKRSESPWVHRLALLLAACTLFVILTGTAVTANQERPLYSFGQWHAVAGVLVGIFALVLGIWLSRAEKGARALGWITVAAVTLEGLLGLPSAPQPAAVKVFHALLAQILFAILVAIALFPSNGWKRAGHPVKHRSAVRTLAEIAPAVVLVQAVLGVALRQGVIELMPHVLGALAVAAFILTLCTLVIYRPEHEALRSAGVAVLVITSAQLALGFALFAMGAVGDVDPLVVIITTMIHAATAASALAAAAVLAALAWRGIASE